ncbi:MAG: glutamate--tRNA ligase [Gammaproteobacteria bacterium]|jgi:nondiscriminating glutamyl-tRNA synthetase|nr:glutamate--tRNA ligase [Gammaproteobacteria bacterium]
MNQKVRVRFAPSPTGSLHLGGVRTALYNYLFAKHHGGEFILRVEDTDQERSTDASRHQQLEELKWLGLNWDEGPEVGGAYGPYMQSLRLDYYQEIAQKLIDIGLAYYCFLTDEQIESLRENDRRWVSPYRDLSIDEARKRILAGDAYVLRFRLPDVPKTYVLNDWVRGEVALSTEGLTDFVLLRFGGMPVYNFCCVCDDHAMLISHVFRGEEHLPNSLKQMLLYDALGWKAPEFGHLSVIVNEERRKLSKRDGAVSVGSFRDEGYLPAAILNAVALLGWSHPDAQDIFSLKEMIRVFDGKRLGASSAYFDREKMRWTNAMHIRQLTADDLWSMLWPYVADLNLPSDAHWPKMALAVYQTEIQTLSDAKLLLAPFSLDAFRIEGVDEIFTWEKTLILLKSWRELLLTKGDYVSSQEFSAFIEAMKEQGLQGKKLFMPLRAAIIGKLQGAEMQMLVQLMPKKELLRRINQLTEVLM